MTAFYRPEDRLNITRKILSITDPSATSPEDVRRSFLYWWRNIRSTGGFGLTDSGDSAFLSANMAHSDFPIGDGNNLIRWITPLRSLEFERKLSVPYYLSLKGSIRIYDDRVAMMVVLHGTVGEYLSSIEPWTTAK